MYRAPITQKSVGLSIVLCIVTCGLYGIYWMYTLNEDMNAASNAVNPTPGFNVLAFTLLTCGIYGLYWMYMQGEKVDYIKNQRGIPSSNTGILYLILNFLGLGLVAYALMQHELNQVI